MIPLYKAIVILELRDLSYEERLKECGLNRLMLVSHCSIQSITPSPITWPFNLSSNH